MKLRRLGFFRELRHGDPDGPSLRESIGAQRADEELIARYLEQGHVLIGCPGVVGDVLSNDPAPVAAMHILTDGTWVWPGDLPCYVRKYHVALPEAFVEHVRNREFRHLPSIDPSSLEF